MSARKRKRPKDFAARVNAALDRIAATIENGELMWVALEVPIASAKVCHGDYVEITAGVCEGDEPGEVTQ